MKPALVAVFAALSGALLMASQASLAAGDVKAGRAKTSACATCHGIDSMSKLPEAPNLAGQTEEYLVKALNDFRLRRSPERDDVDDGENALGRGCREPRRVLSQPRREAVARNNRRDR